MATARSAAAPAFLVATAVVGGGLTLSEAISADLADVVPSAVGVDVSTAPPPVGQAIVPSVAPVAMDVDESLPSAFDAAALVKVVALAEEQEAEAHRQAEEAERSARREEEAAREETERNVDGCAAGDDGFETVRSWVADAGIELRCRFAVEDVLGVAGRSNASDHPAGLALDFMVDRDPGEQLAQYSVDNMDRLGISYVIYRQRINTGSGWEQMEDRGGITANHMDHVHISFGDR